MKRTLLLLSLATITGTAWADDVAVMHVKNGGKIGRVVIEFYEDSAPNTVANFKKLAAARFYNGTTFHRAFPHLMVQGGDPLSKRKDNNTSVGIGGPGYTLPPEIRRKNITGAVAAARLPDKINPGRVSNGSQFYVALQPMPTLDGQYTVFGRVVAGLDVLDAISQVRTDTNDNPVERVVIESIKIVPREAAATTDPTENRVRRIFHRIF